MEISVDLIFMLVCILLYIYTTRDFYKMPCQKVPIGYFNKDLKFIPSDIHYRGNWYNYIRTPKMLRPYKDSPLFWIDIKYRSDISQDDIYVPLHMSKKACSSIVPSGRYMLFSFDKPIISDMHFHKGFMIVRSGSELLLVTNYEYMPEQGPVLSFSISGESFSEEQLYVLGRLIS